MEKVYIMGHKRPDTDSVTAAITLAYLKNQLGLNAEPVVLGDISKETSFALNYFHTAKPKYLNNVRLQIRDVNYHRGYFLRETSSIYSVYHFMMEKGVTGVPLVDENQKLTGLVTEKMLVKELVGGDFTNLETTYDNILATLQGERVLCFDQEIKGVIQVASYRSTTFLNQIPLDQNSILIVGDRHSIIEYAVASKVKLLIIVGNGEIKEEHLKIAEENKVNILRTSLDTFHTAKMISLANYVKNISSVKEPVAFDHNDSYDDFLEESRKLKHNNYPVVDKTNTCLGLIRVTDVTEKHKKKVILVDHNEKEQSVNGLEEAEILEIVDHHKIGDLTTSSPINFRNMAVGSTNTIIYYLYKENHVQIPYEIAGLMMSGILSDTLGLNSPTTTIFDREVIDELEKITGLDAADYALTMLKTGTSLKGKSMEEIVQADLKVFPIRDERIAIAQVLTFNSEEVLQAKDEYLATLNQMVQKNDYQHLILVVTDILKQGSYFLYTKGIEKVLSDSFELSNIEEGFFISGILSRKKQVVPVIVDTMEGR